MSSRAKRYAQSIGTKESIVRLSIMLLGAVLVCVKAWIWRNSIVFGDIVQYLDMGDYFLSGQFDKAVSGCWSPLYPICLGLFLKVFGVSLQAAIGGMRVFNCLAAIGCFASFLVMFRTLRLYVFTQFRKHQDLRRQLPSPSWFTTVGVAVAIFVFCGLSTPAVDTPDMLTALLFCWCFNALLLCIVRPRLRNGAAMGALLAATYLCNAVAFIMFPLFLFVLWMKTKRKWLVVVATVAFVTIALPWIAAISIKQGMPTVSTRWFATHIKTALAITPYNSPSYCKMLRHPPGVICAWPRVLDFSASDGTNPQSWDLNRWVDGMSLPVMPNVMFVMLVSNFWFYLRTFLMFLLLVLLIPSKNATIGLSRRAFMSTRVITLIPIVMLVLFGVSTNLYVYGFAVRFVLVPILLLMITVVLLQKVKDSAPISWRANVPSIVMTSFVALSLVCQLAVLLPLCARGSSNLSNAVASSLLGLGIKSGANFAYMTSNEELWVREVGGRATTAIYLPQSFFALESGQRQRLTDRLKAGNIAAIVYNTAEPEYITMSPLEEDGRAIGFVMQQEVPEIPKEPRPAPPKSQGWLQVTGHPVYILLLNDDFDQI